MPQTTTERIRFHLDENVDPVIAIALRRYGIDVTTTVEAGLRTADDESQLAFAKRESRVVVTHDDDFYVWLLAMQTIQGLLIAISKPGLLAT